MDKIFNLYIYWDPSRELTSWNVPFLDRPILWYGLFFALGVFFAYLVFKRLLTNFLSYYGIGEKEIAKVREKIALYTVIGTIFGARLGDVLFYQSPHLYFDSPLRIFAFWEGGLSSHGAVIGIMLSLWILRAHQTKSVHMLSWVAMLDLLVIPALLAGTFIRIGNFFNQEILGTESSLPWAIVFGHPIDGSLPVPRHPAQLYEALFYFLFFIILWSLRKLLPKMFIIGKTSGLFFIVVFTFRFLVEFVKMPQSELFKVEPILNMGQILSIPFILLGCFLFFRRR